MEIYVSQIYIQPNINFNFSYIFQRFIHSYLSDNIIVSNDFKYINYKLMFRMSAKRDIIENEIKGPTIFKKDKDIEYTIFLPYDEIIKHENYNMVALKYLFNGMYTIFEKYNFNYSHVTIEEEKIIKIILENKEMFQE